MAYQSWSVSAFEQPSTSKWNIVGSNMDDLNTRLGVIEGFPYSVVYTSAAQTISTSTFTAVGFDAEISDDYAMHDNVTNNSRLTIPTGEDGLYLVVFKLEWASNSSGDRITRLYVNGSGNNYAYTRIPPSASSFTAYTVSAVLPLSAGDYVQQYVWQNSGGDLDITANDNMLSITRIR